MNYEEREYFAALNRDRADSADTFEKPANRKIWKSIVEKYSDQAHFIYELIQNADDAGADFARFILEKDRLVFIHNGKRRFSVSNPENEDSDSETGKLGDINAITGIAFSNKKQTENKIGKFGVGFKSVFQYTVSPHIYDPGYRFRIERYIIPVELEDDFPGRKAEETVFVFPFDHPEKNKEETYSDIADKLKSLVHPVLFLTNLMTIAYETEGTFGIYEKNITQSVMTDGTAAEKINLLHAEGNESSYTGMWMFSRFDSSFRYSVCFCLDENGELTASNEPAFCYFPTREQTGLGFLVHAPFLLTDSREGIRAGIPHNESLIEKLSDLAADSVLYLRDIGLNESKMLINDRIFSVIPFNEEKFSDPDDKNMVSFRPFCTKIKNIFALNEIIPASDCYVSAENAYWAADSELPSVFSDRQLAEMCDVPDAKWVFRSFGADDVQRTDGSMFLFISSVINSVVTEDDLMTGRRINSWSTENEIRGIDSAFMKNQDRDWITGLYLWLMRSVHRTETAAKIPVFPDSNSVFSAVFDEYENELMFLPSDGLSSYHTVREDMLEDPVAAELLRKTGIKKPSLRDEIFSVIIPKYRDRSYTDENGLDFMTCLRYWRESTHKLSDRLVTELKKCRFIRCVSEDRGTGYRFPEEVYMPDENLVKYFESKPGAYFADMAFYCSLPESDIRETEQFLSILGVKRDISVSERSISPEEVNMRDDLPEVYSTGKIRYTEKYIDGMKELIEYTVKNRSEEKSVLVWNTLLGIIKRECRYGGLSNLLKGYCEYFSVSAQRVPFNSPDAETICNEPWLIMKNGNFVKASRTAYSGISDLYDKTSDEARELLKFLGIENLNSKEKKESAGENSTQLTNEQRDKIATADLCRKLGLTEDDLREMAGIKQSRMPEIKPINLQPAAKEPEPRTVNASEELKMHFDKLRYTDRNQFNGRSKSIQLVLGMSGKDKTDNMAAETIIPLMYGTEDKKVIMISSSEEQADRLAQVILETAGSLSTGWLVRFGKTEDENVKDSPVYHDRSFDINTMERCVVVTTVSHFISDCFMPHDECIYLKDMAWDSIILDESTIIPEAAQEVLAYMLGVIGNKF